MSIRHATAADLPALQDIEAQEILHGVAHFGTQPDSLQAWQARFAAKDPRHPWLVADTGGVVGYALAGRHKQRAAYDWCAELGVYLRPLAQGKGLGRALVTALIAELQAAGVRTLVAGVALPNPASVALFESLGFAPVGVFPKVGFKAGRWRDVGYWTRHVGDGPPGPGAPV